MYPGRGLEESKKPSDDGFLFSGSISVRLSTPLCLFINNMTSLELPTTKTFPPSLRPFALAGPRGGVENLVEHPIEMIDRFTEAVQREIDITLVILYCWR